MEHKHSIRIYLAGPLFTQAEWQWNERLAEELQARSLEVILPQRHGMAMLSGEQEFDPALLFQMNLRCIDSADVVVAILDGADVDSGTAWECGYAFRAGKPVVGVRTDIRAGGDDPAAATNLMLSIGCTTIVSVPLSNRVHIASVADLILHAVRGISR